jgi:nucleoside-diphosphate-sugar epimerase
MSILVTGGSGELGRPALNALVAAGQSVRATTRSAQSDKIAASLGVQPQRVDLFDARAVRSSVEGADTVIHLATAIPPTVRMADLETWAINDRLRAETTAHLVDAALAAGCSRFVLQSYFAVQAPRGDEWIEADPAVPSSAWSGIPVMDTMQSAEELAGRFASGGGAAVVLRFGSLYSETSEQLQAQVRFLEGGDGFIPGAGLNYWPFVESGDAGRAVAAALGVPAGTYNVADDEPVTLERFWTTAASVLATPTPPHVHEVGGPMAEILLGSWRLSNRAFVDVSGWRPRLASVVDGWPEAARRFRAERPGLRPAYRQG